MPLDRVEETTASGTVNGTTLQSAAQVTVNVNDGIEVWLSQRLT